MIRTIRYTLSVTLIMTGTCTLPARAQIVRTDQKSGTNVLLIAVSPVSENVVWVSGAQGTWLRSVDGGNTWRGGRVPGADSLQFRDVHAVDANTAYLLSIGSGTQSRIYKTTDAGRNWALQFTNTEPRGFYDCFDFWNERRALVIGDAIEGKLALLITSDGGENWAPIASQSLPPAPSGEGSFAASGTCLKTGPRGRAWIVASNPQQARVLHATNYGRNWSAIPLPMTTRQGVGPQSVLFLDELNGMVLGGGYGSLPGDTLALSTNDNGETWVVRARPPLASGVWGAAYVPGAEFVTIVAVGPNGAVYTRDDGNNWNTIDNFNYWSVGFASARAGWAVGAGGRITKLSGF